MSTARALAAAQGTSSAVDEAQDAIEEAEAQLASYLKRASKELGGQVTYVSLHKETHVLEVPQVSLFPFLSPSGPETHHEGCTCTAMMGSLPTVHQRDTCGQLMVGHMPCLCIGIMCPRSLVLAAATASFKTLACSALSSVALQALEKKVPGSFERLAHRKGFVRYMSGELRRLSTGLGEARQALELALSGVLKVC